MKILVISIIVRLNLETEIPGSEQESTNIYPNGILEIRNKYKKSKIDK